MSMDRVHMRHVALLSAAALLGGCVQPSTVRHFDGDPWVQRNGDALDRMAVKLNEYGTVGMSAPLIVSPDDRFDFKVAKGPNEYFNDAKADIQTRTAAVEQDVSLLGLSASANIDPTQMAKYSDALKNYEDERIDYLRHRTERDRALNTATAANNAAARINLEAQLKLAEQEKDPAEQVKKRAAAYQEYATALTTNAGVAPTVPVFPTPDKPTAQGVQGDASTGATNAQAYLPDGNKRFITPGTLLGSAPSVSSANRSALIMAAGDTAVEGILGAMHSSEKSAALLGKQKLFGVAMVSITPGWRTKSDFAARLTIRPTLEREVASAEISQHVFQDLKSRVGSDIRCRRLSDPVIGDMKYRVWWDDGTDFPYRVPAAITAVSPMIDAQHLQLSNSLRKRKEQAFKLALALQMAGLDAGAKLFYEHLKDLEKDMLSDNREVAITAFATGSQFGYEIGPELWSQTDPAASKPKPGYRLVRQSFPTLILLGFDEEQLHPLLRCDPDAPDSLPTVLEPKLQFAQVRRWVPLNEKAAPYAAIDGEIVSLDDEVTRAFLSDAVCGKAAKCIPEGVFKEISARGNALAEELMGNRSRQSIPMCMVTPDLPRCVVEAKREAKAKEDMKSEAAKQAHANQAEKALMDPKVVKAKANLGGAK